MTRKRISDLLREEAQNNPAESSTGEAIASESAKIRLARPAETVPEPQIEHTSASLEIKIQELTAALKTAEQKAIALEAELGDRQTQIATLTQALDKAEQAKKELDTQKKLVTKLSGELEEQKKLVVKLYSELSKENPLQAELEAQKALVTQLYAEIESLKTPTPAMQSASQKSIVATKVPPRPVYRSIVRPVGKTLPGQLQDTGLSNETIGWFD
jgi:chromosome segregation ATPase